MIRYTKIFYVGLFCILGNIPSVSYSKETLVQQSLGDDKLQGLKYINDTAIDFLNNYNKEHQTNWKSSEPNAKIGVGKCVIPMTAYWHILYISGYKITVSVERYVIRVSRKKDINGEAWNVDVSTTRPDRITVHK